MSSFRVKRQATLLSLLLILLSCANAVMLFLSKRPYRLHYHKDPSTSPNAHYVDADMRLESQSVLSWIK